MRLRKLYCISGFSGSGKTRMLLSMLLTACIPEIYDLESDSWILTGATGKGVFISTELEEIEIKIPAVCFIAGVEEHKLHDSILTKEEQVRIDRALKILENSEVHFEELHDFDMEDLEHVITKNINKYGIEYVAFDYIHSTLKLFDSMAKQGAKNLQEHQVLRIMTIRLKNMCNRLDIWIGTATQLNENFKTDGNLDQSSLEGSKSIANKLDFGAIQLPLSEKDSDVIKAVRQGAGENAFGEMPTHTINIYKNRGNRWSFIRIFVVFNLGTLRMRDVFVLNYKNELITNIKPKKIALIKSPVSIELKEPKSTQDALPNSIINPAPPAQEFNF